MNDTKSRIEGLHTPQVKSLVKLAKELGFKGYCMPYKAHGCAQPGLSNFVVDWSFHGGPLPNKLIAMKSLKECMRQARRDYFDFEAPNLQITTPLHLI